MASSITDTIQSGEVVSPDFPLRIDFSVNIGGITSRNEMIPETLYCESIEQRWHHRHQL